ncbi:hypothetical protein GOP47_0023795 [Adiantum capillus-veneris]|uniref:Uncharacterized protein n=1 Tax=Adiantum capillus-veneris TaxID=13818 RepID=A0A9D4U572_ADICA|nr:hypothetical protein GOP47_0023795 [Adiantum capillus-veneris]
MGLMTRAQKPSPENGGKSLTKPDPLVQYVFTLSTSAIKKLKSEACEGFTSFELTCVHFWKRTSSARKSPPSEKRKCRGQKFPRGLHNEEANGDGSIVAILKDLLAEGEKLVHPDLMADHEALGYDSSSCSRRCQFAHRWKWRKRVLILMEILSLLVWSGDCRQSFDPGVCRAQVGSFCTFSPCDCEEYLWQ